MFKQNFSNKLFKSFLFFTEKGMQFRIFYLFETKKASYQKTFIYFKINNLGKITPTDDFVFFSKFPQIDFHSMAT